MLKVKHKGLIHCSKLIKKVNDQYAKRCKRRKNKLTLCKKCDTANKNWPVIDGSVDVHLLNSGNDVLGNLMSTGNDSHWEVGEGSPHGPSSVASWLPAHIYADSAWDASPFSNANWISHKDDAYHKDDKDYYYRLSFYLESDISPDHFGLTLKYLVDNSIYDIYVNDVKQSIHSPSSLPQFSSSPYVYRGFEQSNEGKIELTHNWKSCENEVIIHIKSSTNRAGLLAHFESIKCVTVDKPEYSPSFSISWGERLQDCIPSRGCQTFCITICNPYSNIRMENLIIGSIKLSPASSNNIVPMGAICFGTIEPCSCISREFVLTSPIKPGKYKILVDGICFDVCWHYELEKCFELKVCK